MSDTRPGGCEFDPRLRWTFFPAYFHLSPLQKHVRKVVGGFGKKSCVSRYWCEKAMKHMCVTDHLDMTLAVKVALNPNTTNQTNPGFTGLQYNSFENMSNFSFSHSVFYSSVELSTTFIKFKIVICKPFKFEESEICHLGKGSCYTTQSENLRWATPGPSWPSCIIFPQCFPPVSKQIPIF